MSDVAAVGLLGRLCKLYRGFETLAEKVLSIPVDLAARYLLGWTFFSAGWGRVTDWGLQEFMFTDVHPVPGLPASIAAIITTAGELVLPVLLWLGLCGRAAALGLLMMTAVIQFVVGQTEIGQANGIANADHYWWMLVAAFLVVRGPSVLSLDRLLFGKKD